LKSCVSSCPMPAIGPWRASYRIGASAANPKFAHPFPAKRVANVGFKSGTRIIELLVSLRFRSSHQRSPRPLANFGIGTRAARVRASRVGGALEGLLALQTIVSGEAAHHLVAHPVLQDAAQVLPRNARHGGEVGLAHLLAHQDAAGADVLAE